MQHRQNRRDPKNEDHDKVWAEPRRWTRASRRAAGYREPVHAEVMRAFYDTQRVLPRAVRRLMRDADKAMPRLKRNRTKVNRLLTPYGVRL